MATMRAKLRWPAPDEHTIFGPGCMDRQVGKTIEFNYGHGVLVGYEIIDEGRTIILDVDEIVGIVADHPGAS